MSNDEVRWCDDDDNAMEHESTERTSSENVNDSYTFLSVYHIKYDKDTDNDDQISVININNRDSRRNGTTNNPAVDSTKQQKTLTKHLLRLIALVLLHILCNFLVSSVNADDLLEAVGARGHFTHTWAVHIPGGIDVAKQVADDHEMLFRGKVSRNDDAIDILLIQCGVTVTLSS